MRTLHLILLACISLSSCDRQQRSSSLPEAFVQSLEKQDFELLEPYFPTVEFHRSLERNGTDGSDSAAVQFVQANNQKLKENWKKISDRVAANKVDFAKVKIVDTISAQPFWTKKISRTVVVYTYGNGKWDDMEFIVGDHNGKKLLLEIPEPDKVFSMTDSSLTASKSVKFEIDIRTPEFKNTLQDKVEEIIALAKANKVQEFSEQIHYPTDATSSPQPDSASAAERSAQMSAGFMEKINSIMSGCGQPVFGDVNSLDLPEGKWIVIQMKCNTQFVHFAFIRVNDKILLSDVDAAGIK